MQPSVEDLAIKARPVFEKYGVKRARIFGSFARGEAGPESDIDLVVDLKKPLGFAYFSFQDELEQALGREVDVLTENSINKFLRPYILPELKVLYEGG